MLLSPALDIALTEPLRKTRAAAAGWQTFAIYININDEKFLFLFCHFLARFAAIKTEDLWGKTVFKGAKAQRGKTHL